jgi:hypothetical protein
MLIIESKNGQSKLSVEKRGLGLLKSIILSILTKVQRKFGFYHKSLVYIEGGLGSQILGIISFWERQAKYGLAKARCDLSYFSSPNRGNLWNWELDHYQINKYDLQRFESVSSKNLFKMKSDFLSDQEVLTNYWAQVREKYFSRFQYDHNSVNDFKANVLQIDDLKTYGVIHIRRGDYLQVASKIIEFDEYLNFLVSIQGMLPKCLLIVSDSQLQNEEKEFLIQFLPNVPKVIFLDNPHLDPFMIHCLMREAELLVAANSTFSFSAALLGKSGQIAFSPVDFHAGRNSEKYNRSFRIAGSFMALKMDK